MKNYFLIRKAAIIAGICIIVLSAVMFLAYEIINVPYAIENLKNANVYNTNAGTAIYISMIGPFSYLVSGFGFGGILTLLALMFDPEKVAPFKQRKEEPEAEEN